MLLINLFILNYYLIMAKTTINYININYGKVKSTYLAKGGCGLVAISPDFNFVGLYHVNAVYLDLLLTHVVKVVLYFSIGHLLRRTLNNANDTRACRVGCW